jgi:hypothetical protein
MFKELVVLKFRRKIIQNFELLKVYTPFHEKSTDAGTIAWNALANAGILLGVIAVITVLLILVGFSFYH